jgi:hypothetical protein
MKAAAASVSMTKFSKCGTHVTVAAKPHERTVQLSAAGGKLVSAAQNKRKASSLQCREEKMCSSVCWEL